MNSNEPGYKNIHITRIDPIKNIVSAITNQHTNEIEILRKNTIKSTVKFVALKGDVK